MTKVAAREFSLQASLFSGQTFRWKPHNGWLYGVLGSALVRVRQANGHLEYESSEPSVTPKNIIYYFALDLDLSKVLNEIDADMQIHEAILSHRGLRVLRQDGWEALASFICASFNNIKRITGMIEALCQTYGRPVTLNGFRSFTFPDASVLAHVSERKLRSLGLGYRAPYLLATARLVADGGLSMKQLGQADYSSTKKALLQCDGVGDKVADCVALFGFEKYEAFPIDVWIERAMRYYFRHKMPTRSGLHAYAQRHFGPFAGYAQQYLYHWIRNARKWAGAR